MKYYSHTKILIKSIPKIFCKKKVDFIICGTQKGGTTALYSYVSEHPEISMASRKEVHFFDNDSLFLFNYSFYPIYHSFFNFKQKNKIFGEATPIYMFWKKSPVRMWKYNPDLKLILILRNPVDRAFSNWNMNRNRNIEHNTFLDSLKKENFLDEKSNMHQSRMSYISRGFYSQQIKRIWDYFPKEQTLILKNEELLANPTDTLNRVYKFLNIGCVENVERRIVFSNEYKRDMSSYEKEYLINIYRDEIKELEALLDWDCSDWLNI